MDGKARRLHQAYTIAGFLVQYLCLARFSRFVNGWRFWSVSVPTAYKRLLLGLLLYHLAVNLSYAHVFPGSVAAGDCQTNVGADILGGPGWQISHWVG